MNYPTLKYFSVIINFTHLFLSLPQLGISLLTYPSHIYIHPFQTCVSGNQGFSNPFFTTVSCSVLRPVHSQVLMTFLLNIVLLASLWCKRECLAEINQQRLNRRIAYTFITVQRGEQPWRWGSKSYTSTEHYPQTYTAPFLWQKRRSRD